MQKTTRNVQKEVAELKISNLRFTTEDTSGLSFIRRQARCHLCTGRVKRGASLNIGFYLQCTGFRRQGNESYRRRPPRKGPEQLQRTVFERSVRKY